MNKRLGVLSLAVGALLGSGCASITTGKQQRVSITTTCQAVPVSGANCTLDNPNGSYHVITPGAVTIRKAYGDMSVECRKGKSAGSRVFVSGSNSGVWGNILAGGIIGYAVDASTGSGFNYPSQMDVSLNPPCPK